jgi:hypothetical protein
MASPAPPSEDPISSQFPYPAPPHPDTKRTKTIGKSVGTLTLGQIRDFDIDNIVALLAVVVERPIKHKIRQLTAPNKVLVSMGMYQITAQDLLASQRLRNLLMTSGL